MIFYKIPDVCVGTTHDTSEFAVNSISKWWRFIGKYQYPTATELLILADSGGSNGARNKAWKYFIQKKLCNKFNLTITLSHYPAGASKWNPIEHRMFSEISKNWRGIPLINYETVLNYIKTTTTKKNKTILRPLPIFLLLQNIMYLSLWKFNIYKN